MSTSPVIPLGPRVLLQHIEQQGEMSGGIYIPEGAQDKSSQQAKVIALGTPKRDEHGNVTPFGVKEGDTVLIQRYGGLEIKVGAQRYVLVSEEDIWGLVSA